MPLCFKLLSQVEWWAWSIEKFTMSKDEEAAEYQAKVLVNEFVQETCLLMDGTTVQSALEY